MGVDLTLFPVDYQNDFGGSAFSRLQIDRRRELWEDILKVPSELFGKLVGYAHDKFGERIKDAYGDPLRYVIAADLAALALHEAVQDSSYNRAIWAYLSALNPNTKICLYWH